MFMILVYLSATYRNWSTLRTFAYLQFVNHIGGLFVLLPSGVHVDIERVSQYHIFYWTGLSLVFRLVALGRYCRAD